MFFIRFFVHFGLILTFTLIFVGTSREKEGWYVMAWKLCGDINNTIFENSNVMILLNRELKHSIYSDSLFINYSDI